MNQPNKYHCSICGSETHPTEAHPELKTPEGYSGLSLPIDLLNPTFNTDGTVDLSVIEHTAQVTKEGQIISLISDTKNQESHGEILSIDKANNKIKVKILD